MTLSGNQFLIVVSACVFALGGTACSSSPDAGVSETRVEVNNGSLILDGDITPQAVERIRQLSTQHQFSQLEVNSAGGDPLAAIQLGGWVHRQQLNIRVRELCLHSCANYLFTAAHEKELLPGAVVAWSGGALEESWTQQWQHYLIPGVRHIVEQYLDRFLRRETRFFERIGVDQQITVYGYNEQFGCMDENTEGFYYSIPDLFGMGVTQITTSAPSWQLAFTEYGEQFCKVELSSRTDVKNI